MRGSFMEQNRYDSYVRLLKQELVPAMGCTEPIAVAYAAASAARELEILPETVDICVSANIIKNVKSVVVPNTGGLRGLAAAAAAGIIAGDPTKQLLVISEVTEAQQMQIADLIVIIHIIENNGFRIITKQRSIAIFDGTGNADNLVVCLIVFF